MVVSFDIIILKIVKKYKTDIINQMLLLFIFLNANHTLFDISTDATTAFTTLRNNQIFYRFNIPSVIASKLVTLRFRFKRQGR